MATAENVRKRLHALYGDSEGAPRDGFHVLHVAATWRAPDSSLRVIRIGPKSPRSETDHFVLRAARMRSDAIVSTGKILREEAGLTHDESDPELLAWRRDLVQLPLPPQTVILSSGLALDFAHPLLGRVPTPLLVIPESNVADVIDSAEASGVHLEIVGRDEPGLRDVLSLLRERGATRITVEAGPSTSRELYREPVAVDELWLSIFEEPSLDAACIGEPFAEEAELRAIFDRASSPVTRSEESGRWTFQRLWRSR